MLLTNLRLRRSRKSIFESGQTIVWDTRFSVLCPHAAKPIRSLKFLGELHTLRRCHKRRKISIIKNLQSEELNEN